MDRDNSYLPCNYFLEFHNQTFGTSAMLCGFFGQKYLQYSVLLQLIGLKISHRATSAIASKNRNMQEAPSSNNILILLSIAWGEIEKEIVISCHVDDFDKKNCDCYERQSFNAWLIYKPKINGTGIKI